MEGNSVIAFAWGVAKLPGSLAYLALRLFDKKETLGTALQRLGWSSIERRNGPVLWFHVNGVGETSTVLPVVFRCLQEYNEKVTVLVTTACLDVYKLLVETLPQRVLVQMVPMANPLTITAFLRKWQPQVGVFLETPFHRELALMARETGVRLALLNAHMPGEDMIEWHARHTSREMLKQTLRSYSLIVPRTYVDVGRFRMFGATLGQMPGWSTDLQQASELGACATRLLHQRPKICRALLKRLAKRQLWIAANTLPGEDAVVARIHATLRSRHKGLLTLIAPRVIAHSGGRTASGPSSQTASVCAAVVRRVSAEKRLQVELLSMAVEEPERLTSDVDVLVLDDPDALTALYSLSEVVLVGGSLLPSLDGASSPAAPAVAGCALLMGPHGAEFQGMATDLNHAAIMASDEVAAAVAQTGATMRGINPAGFDTPRESRAPEPGRESTSTGVPFAGAAPRTGALDSFGSIAVEGGGAAEDGGASGSSGPTWQQLVSDAQRPVRSSRPMSAPPTVPEFFGLRPVAPSFGLSPLGGLSYESSLQPGLNGQTVLIAPFTTPGVPYGFGGHASPAHSPQQTISLDHANPASAPTACGTTGNRTRRRAIDRFRWATSREVIGFGYTQEKDSEDSASESSTSDSEEEEQGVAMARNADGAPLAGRTSAVGPCVNTGHDVLSVQAPVAGGSECLAPRASANVQASTGCGSEESRQPAVQQAAATDTVTTSGTGVSPLPSAGSARRHSPAHLDCDDSVGSEMDDSDFHDAVETEQVGEGASRQTAAVASEDLATEEVTSGSGTAIAPAGAIASAWGLDGMSRGVEKVDQSEDALQQQQSAELPGEEAEVSAASAAPVVGSEDASEAGDAQEPAGGDGATDASQRYRARYNPEESGEVSARSLRVPQLTEYTAAFGRDMPPSGFSGLSWTTSDAHGSRDLAPAPGEAPVSRGTHLGHLVICRDGGGASGGDDLEVVWPKRLPFREARHMVSDPGLPTDPRPRPSSAAAADPCGLSQQWPIASSSLVDTVHHDSASVASCAASGASECSSVACSAPIAIQTTAAAAAAAAKKSNPADLSDAALGETWANDVNMVTIFEDEGAFPVDSAVPLVASQPGSATAAREAYGIWAESPQPSFRGSLDHYLQSENPLALLTSPPSFTRGRAARGSLTRMGMKMLTSNDSMTNLVALDDTAAVAPEAEGKDQETVPDCKDAASVGSNAAGADPGRTDSIDGFGDEPGSAALLPLPPRVTIGEDAATADGDLDSNSDEPSPTVVSAAVVEGPVIHEEGLMGSSPTSFAALSSGGSLGSGTAAPLSGPAAADSQSGCTAESPKSDFEFGGSVPDDAGSGSPTLLATASVHNGSGANLQSYIAADGQEAGSQPSEAAAGSQSGGQRPNSRSSSPSSTHSWSESGPSRSPTRNGSPVMQPSRFQAPGASRQPVPPQSAGGIVPDSSPFNAGSCFAGQTCFHWLPDGGVSSAAPPASIGDDRSRSVSGSGGEGIGPALGASASAEVSAARGASLSTAVSAASISTRSSTGFHQVASIGSWLDHFGAMLPQPSAGLQRSQAQHDPRVWFSQQLGQRDANGGMPAPAVALEGVAPGLRAPMHSPLRAFDDDKPPGINPQALASVTMTLFPVAHTALSYPAPLPPPATGILSPRAAATNSSSPLRPASSVSSDQVTSAFTVGRSSQYSAAASSAGLASTFKPPPPPAYARPEPVVVAAETKRRSTQTDELSALLNSPRSPVSPVRVARAVSPVTERRVQMPGGPLSSPSQPKETSMPECARGGSSSANTSSAGEQPQDEPSQLPVALPSINTPRRELQRRLSAPVRRASPSSSPLRTTFSVVPGAAALFPVSPRAGGLGGMCLNNSAASDTAAGGPAVRGLQSHGSDGSSDCPNTPTSRAADTASSPFREPRQVPQPPKSPNFHNDPERFEESFDAAVRAGPTKSPARPAGSVHVSPFSSPYKSPFAAAMASSVAAVSSSPGPGTAFRSLFLEEEEEEQAAGQEVDNESEDPEPLSPRANSHNVLFSMQAPRDDRPLTAAAAGPAALRGATLRGGLSPGARTAGTALSSALLPPLLPSVGSAAAALPSVFAQQAPQVPHRLSYGSGGGTLAATASTGHPGGPSPFLARNVNVTSAAQDSCANISASTGVAAHPTPMDTAETAPPTTASQGITLTGNMEGSPLPINLDKAPTFSRIPSLVDTDDDEGGSDTPSPSRQFSHLAESLAPRQPRITLSGGVLVVPAVPGGNSSGSSALPKSNLSQTSTARLDDSDRELEREPSMGLPDVSAIAPGEPEETPRASRSVDGSRSGSCSSIASVNVGGGGVQGGRGGSGSGGGVSALAPGSSAAGGMSGHGSAASLASSSAAAGSPPRSPEQRTRCSESNCPSASPVKPPLHSTQSSPVPRSFISDAQLNVPLPYMPALPSQHSPRSPKSPHPLSPRASASGGVPQLPSSPTASYMSPCATDPRASPIKVMTAVKRTPADVPLRQDPLDVASFFAPFSSSEAAGLASSIFSASGSSPTPDRRFSPSVVAAGLSTVAPVRTQPAMGAPPSPTAAVAAMAGLASTVFSQPTAPWLPRQELWAGGASNDELLLSTRASAPAGFATLADRARPHAHRHSGRCEAQPTLSPQSGAARQSHDLYIQRTQQQQAWDRARAESRNASAAGTPRSARALFSGRESGRQETRDGAPGPLPVSFSSSLCGYMDVVVSPVEAPRSPRLRTSPTRQPVFALDAAVMGHPDGGYSARDALTAAAQEAWEVQQERQLHPYHAASAHGTPRSARVLFPPVPPSGGGGGGHALAEPPSPSWSHVSRRLFPEGGHGAAGTATPDRRSVDELDDFLANMTVQVASPVSPQPRLPPPPVSPRVPGGTPSSGTRHAVAEAAAGPSSGSAASAGRRPSASRRPSSPLLQTALLQQARKTSASGEQEGPQRLSPQRNAPQASLSGQSATTSRSPAAAAPVQQHWEPQHHQQQPQQQPGGEATGSPQQSVPVLPHLPPLPPLPRLRQSPAVRGASVSALPACGPSANWPVLTHPPEIATTPGRAQVAGSNATAPDASAGRRVFRQSAPQLSQSCGPAPTSPRPGPARVSSIPLPGMPPVAEQEALAALESQFMAAEQEAADLPIETRIATPTALPVPGGPFGSDGPGGINGPGQGYRPNTAPEYRAVAPPSPRASPGAFGQMATNDGRPFAGLTAVPEDLKPQAQAGGSGITGDSRGNPVSSQGHACMGGTSAAGAGPSVVAGKAAGAGAGAPSEPRGLTGGIRPGMGQAALPATTDSANTGGQQRQQHDGRRRYGLDHTVDANGLPMGAAPPPTRPSRSCLQHPLATTPERSAVAGAVAGSPMGSTGGGPGSVREQYVAPCARYGDQYLIPAAHVTCDPRVGPAVWIVSNEDELAAALSTLLRDPIERRSRGRAAAQGAARLASSLVTTVWSVLEDMVIAPALQEYITSGDARA